MQAAVNQTAKQLLTFRLAEENYGVDILKVKEIRGWSPVTTIPESPPYILGMLNLRGTVVPVIDLRSRFGMPAAAPTALTVIIVLSTASENGSSREFGLVVDGVSEVVQLEPNAAKDVPDRIGSDCVSGLMEHQNELLMLLDAGRVMQEF